jgi:hypothetical protein
LLEQWRAQWAAHVNRALEDAGASARVDHRSLAAQGIEREPQIHFGPSVVARAARGINTDHGDVAQEIEAVNAALAEIEHQASPATPPGRDQVAAQRRGGILAVFRTAARRVWEKVSAAAQPAPSWRVTTVDARYVPR